MKENLRRLQLIFRFTRLKPEMFYSIQFDDGEVVLQGYPNLLHKVCDDLKFEPTDWGKGKHFVRYNIRIVKA